MDTLVRFYALKVDLIFKIDLHLQEATTTQWYGVLKFGTNPLTNRAQLLCPSCGKVIPL
jgi:hypothetical protein